MLYEAILSRPSCDATHRRVLQFFESKPYVQRTVSVVVTAGCGFEITKCDIKITIDRRQNSSMSPAVVWEILWDSVDCILFTSRYSVKMAKKKTTPKKAAANAPIPQLEESIHVIRGQRVMLDADLAELYGVTTARLNEQVGRNEDRFPDDFAFQLTQQEFTSLMSQNAISKKGRGGRRKRPWAFTEHGVAMLSSVLRSKKAAQVNVEIMRAFVRIRRLLATPGELVEQLQRLAESVQLHDSQIKAITRVLQQMMEPPNDKPTGRIGFQSPGKIKGKTNQ